MTSPPRYSVTEQKCNVITYKAAPNVVHANKVPSGPPSSLPNEVGMHAAMDEQRAGKSRRRRKSLMQTGIALRLCVAIALSAGLWIAILGWALA